MSDRREFLKAAAVATSFFPGRVLGANDRVNAAFIGMGKMGRGNLNSAMRQDNLHVAAVCDIYDRNLNLSRSKGSEGLPRDSR
jgi:NADH/NAD ratio-sensing transcriptional regulator Rex